MEAEKQTNLRISEYDDSRIQLLDYLDNGEYSFISGRSLVKEGTVRLLLLRAGYTQLAMGDWWGSHTYVSENCNHGNAINFIFKDDNPYGYEPGWYPIEEIPRLIEANKPDLAEGKDELRASLLRRFNEFDNLKQQLKEAGKEWFSLNAWGYSQKNDVIHFLLNPLKQETYEFGWYTFDELEQWLTDQGPIVKQKV
jgi:hypothetical protein